VNIRVLFREVEAEILTFIILEGLHWHRIIASSTAAATPATASSTPITIILLFWIFVATSTETQKCIGIGGGLDASVHDVQMCLQLLLSSEGHIALGLACFVRADEVSLAEMFLQTVISAVVSLIELIAA